MAVTIVIIECVLKRYTSCNVKNIRVIFEWYSLNTSDFDGTDVQLNQSTVTFATSASTTTLSDYCEARMFFPLQKQCMESTSGPIRRF